MDFVIIGIISVFLLGAVVFIATFLSRRGKDDDADEIVMPVSSCATCDGSDEKCEHACVMEAAVKDIEYYDDEELDDYIGREANCYSDEEAEQFSEILYTIRPDEVKDWNRSLMLRGINIPNQIKDDVIAMING